ncbi:MAG: hypothetical protein WCK11_02090 [Candidatus Falkowbacteria bacterium]
MKFEQIKSPSSFVNPYKRANQNEDTIINRIDVAKNKKHDAEKTAQQLITALFEQPDVVIKNDRRLAGLTWHYMQKINNLTASSESQMKELISELSLGITPTEMKNRLRLEFSSFKRELIGSLDTLLLPVIDVSTSQKDSAYQSQIIRHIVQELTPKLTMYH